MNKKQQVGSYTAKEGFKNEIDIVLKFNNFHIDLQAQDWLEIMGYRYTEIQTLRAIHIPPRISTKKMLSLGVKIQNSEETKTFKKADILLQVKINDIDYSETISLKKSNFGAGYNQVDKRPVDKYKSFWNIPDSICSTLKLYTGEIHPINKNTLRDKRRMFLDEISANKVEELLLFFQENKQIIFRDVVKGRGGLAANWILVTRKNTISIDWILKDIHYACHFFSHGDATISKRGNLKLGRMTIQRKGGTPDPESLQFKLNPVDLFIAI